MIHHCRLTSTAFLHQVGAKVNSSADLADPADQANQVSLSAARSLPSTRAGGQDDVSFNKLPQMTFSIVFFYGCFRDLTDFLILLARLFKKMFQKNHSNF